MQNLIDTFAETVSPSWALSRFKARKSLVNKREYEATKGSRIYKARQSAINSRDVTGRSVSALRNIARDMEENYDIAEGTLKTLVSGVVGKGISSESHITDSSGEPLTELNEMVDHEFEKWSRCPEVTCQFSWNEMQRIDVRAWLRDGESYVQTIVGNQKNLDHQTDVKVSLELIDAELITDLSDVSNNIFYGIKINDWNKPIEYLVYKKSPNQLGVFTLNPLDYKVIKAKNMLALNNITRVGQLRGVSVFAPALKRFDSIRDTEEADLVATRIAASMAFYIKKGPEWSGEYNNETAQREFSIEPGMGFDNLNADEEIGVINPERPNNMMRDYLRGNYQAGCSGTGASSSSVSNDYNGTYSAQRQELVESWRYYSMLTDSYINRRIDPVRRLVVEQIFQSIPQGLLKKADKNTLFDAVHIPPTMPWIDPTKEANANKIMKEIECKSDSKIIREQGDKPSVVKAQIAQQKPIIPIKKG